MWIAFSRPGKGAGFMSVVSKDASGKLSGRGPDAIVSVRFRRPQDAAVAFPGKRYVATPYGDYAGRVFVTRREVADLMTEMVMEQTTDNFKNSIPQNDDQFYNVCTRAWTVFGSLQDGGPYGRSWNSQQSQLPLGHDVPHSAQSSAAVFDDYGMEPANGCQFEVADDVLDNLSALVAQHPSETADWLIGECARLMGKSENVVRSSLALYDIPANSVTEWV